MKLVEVIKIPVRYAGQTYPRGEQFEMQDGHVNEKLVKVVGEVSEKQTGTPDSKFEGMDVEELKAYAEQHSIDIGNATSVNGIIKKIEDAEKAK